MPPPAKFAAIDKIYELQRELRMRRDVYPGWVKQGKLKASDAIERIAMLEEIIADYREIAQRERLL